MNMLEALYFIKCECFVYYEVSCIPSAQLSRIAWVCSARDIKSGFWVIPTPFNQERVTVMTLSEELAKAIEELGYKVIKKEYGKIHN